jgi:hypothetical protein
MLKDMRFVTVLCLVVGFMVSCLQAQNVKANLVNAGSVAIRPNMDSLRSKAHSAFAYCTKHKYNTDFCLLADMNLHSGVKRLFIWSFKGDSIVASFLMGHGCCDNPWGGENSKDKPAFSNVDGSHCSSLGKYKIGERAWSDWGINVKYVLYGLDSTNSNAYERLVVLHGWDVVSDEEIFPKGTPEGWGCPTVSNNSMLIIDAKLKKSKEDVLFWMYK